MFKLIPISKQKPIQFTPPERCDICKWPIRDSKTTYVDGQMSGVSSWANMCLACAETYANGIGFVYSYRDGHWYKIKQS